MKRGRPRQFDEEEVVGRAMEFFWAHGYRGAGLTELLDHLGLGRQSFYDAFGNKRKIYLRAIDHYRSTQLAQVLELLNGPGSPVENVRAAVRFFEKLARDKSLRGCFVANAMLEINAEDEELRQFLDETMRMLEGGYRKALVAAKRKGELKTGQSPRAIARALTNASIGLAVTSRLGQGPAPSEPGRDDLENGPQIRFPGGSGSGVPAQPGGRLQSRARSGLPRSHLARRAQWQQCRAFLEEHQ